MHGVKLLRLILGNFQHLHGENVEAILLELFNDVADRVLGDGVRFHDGKSALQSFHSWSSVVRRSVLSEPRCYCIESHCGLSSRAKRGILVLACATTIAEAGKHQDPSLRSG